MPNTDSINELADLVFDKQALLATLSKSDSKFTAIYKAGKECIDDARAQSLTSEELQNYIILLNYLVEIDPQNAIVVQLPAVINQLTNNQAKAAAEKLSAILSNYISTNQPHTKKSLSGPKQQN